MVMMDAFVDFGVKVKVKLDIQYYCQLEPHGHMVSF